MNMDKANIRFSSKFRNVMAKLTVPDNFMRTILPIKFIYISSWYNIIVILIEFYELHHLRENESVIEKM